jgi:hypothetical protein
MRYINLNAVIVIAFIIYLIGIGFVIEWVDSKKKLNSREKASVAGLWPLLLPVAVGIFLFRLIFRR